MPLVAPQERGLTILNNLLVVNIMEGFLAPGIYTNPKKPSPAIFSCKKLNIDECISKNTRDWSSSLGRFHTSLSMKTLRSIPPYRQISKASAWYALQRAHARPTVSVVARGVTRRSLLQQKKKRKFGCIYMHPPWAYTKNSYMATHSLHRSTIYKKTQKPLGNRG